MMNRQNDTNNKICVRSLKKSKFEKIYLKQKQIDHMRIINEHIGCHCH